MNEDIRYPDEENKAPPTSELRREQIVQTVAQAFGGHDIFDERPQPKKRAPDYVQQRLINQAEERREKRRLKRLKHEFRNSRMG
jgi:hypothetical protein